MSHRLAVPPFDVSWQLRIHGLYPFLLIAVLVLPTVIIHALHALANDAELRVRDALVGGLQSTVPVTLYVLFFAVPRCAVPAWAPPLLFRYRARATRGACRSAARRAVCS